MFLWFEAGAYLKRFRLIRSTYIEKSVFEYQNERLRNVRILFRISYYFVLDRMNATNKNHASNLT